jgi:hypothetical protein
MEIFPATTVQLLLSLPGFLLQTTLVFAGIVARAEL